MFTLPPSEIDACAMNLYTSPMADVQVILRGLDATRRAEVMWQLALDAAALVRGISLPEGDSPSPVRIKLAHPASSPEITIWRGQDQYPVTLASYLGEVTVASMSPLPGVAACTRVVSENALDAEFDAMCRAAFDVAAHARAARDLLPDSNGFTVNLAEMSSGCDPYCTFVADAVRGNMKVVYRVRMVGGVPFQRSLRVTDAAGRRYTAFLSATGDVEGQRFEQDLLVEAGAHLLRRRDIFAGHDGRVLEDREEHLAPREALERALAVPPARAKLPTELAGEADRGPVKAVMIDAGVDVRLTGVTSRLCLRPADDLTTGAPFQVPLLSYARTPLQHLLDVVDHQDEGATGHGTEMASLILKDLPDAKLDLLRADDIEAPSSTRAIGDRWRDFIQRSGARVVNVSYAFEQEVASCDDLFGPAVRGLPSVLFVFGAGNWSIEGPKSACPAALARAYDNALTVAGSEGAGAWSRISSSSAYGRDFATVAAPFRAVCGFVREDGSSGTRPCSGTSVSAALVSNIALKLIAREPRLTPAEVVSALASSCRREHLDVACGGTVDATAALEAIR
ncbi:S8 family serine peptidase [Sorangium sp. So ce854]|uniref:S8 family serine peptidase n=1 Tax=Sorangium sp. So ce854 TaxID=3133322 RepID=UPI003F5D7FF9